jgi:hypothetical protein
VSAESRVLQDTVQRSPGGRVGRKNLQAIYHPAVLFIDFPSKKEVLLPVIHGGYQPFIYPVRCILIAVVVSGQIDFIEKIQGTFVVFGGFNVPPEIILYILGPYPYPPIPILEPEDKFRPFLGNL